MKLAVFAAVLFATLTGCNSGSSPETKRSNAPEPADKDVPYREPAAAGDGEVALAIEPAEKADEIEPASRAPDEDADKAHDSWTAGAKQRGLNLAATGPTVRESAVAYAQFGADAEVPVWTRQQLIAGFAYLRDIMLAKADSQSRARRLTWLYPDDGCYARAALAGYLLNSKGYPRPHNVFSFGNLSAKTPNHPKGFVNWGYHVAPVVEVEGITLVLDPSIEPKRPLTLREWLEKQSADVNKLKVSVCDAGSMNPNGACHGGAEPAKAALGYIRTNFFNLEEKRQVELGRDPAAVLGQSPPWRPAPAAANAP